MEDPVLRAYLKDFSKLYDLDGQKESDIFEYFSAYCIFLRDFSEHAILDDLVVS